MVLIESPVLNMNAELQEMLVALGARIHPESGCVSDFGDPEAELRAIASGTAVADLSQFALLAIRGADATAFLHAQFSCDVAGLPAGRATYGSYCTAKGRMLATFLLWQASDGWRMMIHGTLAGAIQKRLKMFVLRSKVSIDDLSSTTSLVGIAGASATASISGLGVRLPQDALAVHCTDADTDPPIECSSTVAIPGQRWIVGLPLEQARTLWPALASLIKPAGTAAWDWSDIANGIPQLTPATQEQFVPQMANLEVIGGVSFKKGCYPGQEIVARTQYLGKTKRRMYRAHCSTSAAPGDPVYSDDVAGQANGMVVSSAAAPDGGFDMLVVVQIESATQSKVHVGAADGPVLEFASLPYSLP